jgi:hypothetical protein
MNVKVGSSLVRDMHAHHGIANIINRLWLGSLFIPRIFGVTKAMHAAVNQTHISVDARESAIVRNVT